nr:unnamed protein product [Callosobruchus chinensis]
MNNEDISNKKLTLQGLSKLKLDINLNSLDSQSTEEYSLFDESKLGSLTEKEQISRINAVQNATLLKERNQREQEEKIKKKKQSRS